MLLLKIDYALYAAGGAVAAVWLARQLRRGGDPLRHSPPRVNRLAGIHVWLCISVMILGWSFGGQMGGWIAPDDLNGEQLLVWQGVFGSSFGAVLIILVGLLVAQGTFAGGLRGFGLGRRSLSEDLLLSLAGWLAGLFLTVVMLYVTQWLIRRFNPGYEPPEHGVIRTMKDPAMRFWMRAIATVGAVVLVPIGEEILFRGMLQTAVRKLVPLSRRYRRHRWAAILFVGSLFGLSHGSTPQFIPALVVLGILLGFLYERTGSLRLPILVHMLFNGKSMLWNYLAQNYAHSQ